MSTMKNISEVPKDTALKSFAIRRDTIDITLPDHQAGGKFKALMQYKHALVKRLQLFNTKSCSKESLLTRLEQSVQANCINLL